MAESTQQSNYDETIKVRVVVDDSYTSVTLVDAVGGELLGHGTARRDPGDDPNPVIGFMLASSRAFASASRRAARAAEGLVKHADDIRSARERRDAGDPDPRD